MMKGMLITFEGGEGSGKSTQAGRLVARLKTAGRSVIAAREPGGTPVGESVRRILQVAPDEAGIVDETEVLLFAASRSQLVRQVIIPALKKGDAVVCDRFVDSTTAYQAYARGLNMEDVRRINEFACDGIVPDVTFLLDVDVRLGIERIRNRNLERRTDADRIETEDMSFHEKVRQGYLEIAKSEPARFCMIRGDRPPGVIEAEIWEALESRGLA